MTKHKISLLLPILLLCVSVTFSANLGHAASEQFQGKTYDLAEAKPTDSRPKLKVGDKAPDFRLPSINGETVSLSQFLGKHNVVLSFVPAAWTPVCSEQWPGYNVVKNLFDQNETIILGITVDNLPTLHAWTEQMGGVWFPVLSDFWPHGAVADQYGVLRSSGISERATFLIDKQGVIRYLDVHNINDRPDLEALMREMENLKKS